MRSIGKCRNSRHKDKIEMFVRHIEARSLSSHLARSHSHGEVKVFLQMRVQWRRPYDKAAVMTVALWGNEWDG